MNEMNAFCTVLLKGLHNKMFSMHRESAYGEKLSWKIQIKFIIIINVLRHDALPELRKSEK
jgi:hypothetical protein